MYQVKATVDPGRLHEALGEVNRHLDPSSGFLYVAAIDPEESEDLWQQQANAPESERGPRLVLGLEGEGGSYCFAGVKAESVSNSGEFVIGAAGRLKSWANAVERSTQLIYSNDPTHGQQLELKYPQGYDTIPVRVWYKGDDIDAFFEAHKRRFQPPQQRAQNEKLNEMLQVAEQIAPSSTGRPRSGDLVFSAGRGGPIDVEFLTMRTMANSTMTAGTSQKVQLGPGYPITGLEWEVQDRHLSLLRKITGDPTATVRVQWGSQAQDQPDDIDSVEIAYETDEAYVERRIEVRRENEPVDAVGWSDRSSLFGPSSASRLFASVPSGGFFRELEKTWSLSESKVVQIQPRQVEGQEIAQLQTESQSNQKQIPATCGPSSVGSYLLVPESRTLIESVVGGAEHVKIRSFPIDGQENESSYVVFPASERQAGQTGEPKRFVVIAAHSK